MSDCINIVNFNKHKLSLKMNFKGDDYDTAVVKFSTEDEHGITMFGESTIPVKLLSDITSLIGMCVRRTALQYEIEVLEMQDRIAKGQHPFKDLGGKKDVKKD